MLATVVSVPTPTIMPGGCFPPTLPTEPTEPKPWERNCWDPSKWGTPIQLPSPDSDIQAVEAAKLLG